MADNLTDIQETTADLVDRIESTLATLTRWAANELDRFADAGADSMDVTTLGHVSQKLDGVEDAWNKAAKYAIAQRGHAERAQVDAQIAPEIRALLNATGRRPSGDTGSMFLNPYPPAVQ